MLNYLRTSPFRTVDWRWQRAMGVIAGQQPPPTRKLDEPLGFSWIKKAIRFEQARVAAGDDNYKLMILASECPEIYWAYTLKFREVAMRQAVEAYILARQSDFDIGFRAGIAPEVVEAYEALFFNVREKLNHSEYILHCVVGPALEQALSERLYDVLWKMYGYFCGPHFLAGLISKFPNATWCQTPDAMSAAIQDDAIATLKLKAAIAAKTVAVTQGTQLHLMEQFTKFVEVERNTESQGRAQDQILGHIQALFSGLPFAMGKPDNKNGMDTTMLEVYDQSSVELNFDETMLVATGQRIQQAALLQQIKFPVTVNTQKDLETERLTQDRH